MGDSSLSVAICAGRTLHIGQALAVVTSCGWCCVNVCLGTAATYGALVTGDLPPNPGAGCGRVRSVTLRCSSTAVG